MSHKTGCVWNLVLSNSVTNISVSIQTTTTCTKTDESLKDMCKINDVIHYAAVQKLYCICEALLQCLNGKLKHILIRFKV